MNLIGNASDPIEAAIIKYEDHPSMLTIRQTIITKLHFILTLLQ